MPFVGIPVLGALYPDEADIAVAAGSLIMNLVQVPVALVLLTAAAAATKTAGSTTATAGSTTATAPPTTSPAKQLGGILVATFKKAVVWAPILAFVLIIVGVNLPTRWDGSFTLLGQATGGVALFAVGAVLYAQKIGFSKAIVVNVVMKNLVLPAAVLVGMVAAGVEGDDLGLSVVTIAIPTASIAVIFAVQYGKAEREMATTLFASTVLSVITMGAFIEITDAIK